MAETRKVQTRGQITLIATPDYKVVLTPPNVMIPVADDGGSFSEQTFSQTITFKATDNLNQPLAIAGVSLLMDNNETLKIEDKNDEGLYYYTFTKTNEELKKLPDSGQLTFYITLENESIGAEDDFVVDASFSYAKAKSGRDGTPAYGVNLWTDNQIFIKILQADGYQYNPSSIILNTTLINCDNINVVYKWYHISSEGEEKLIQQGTSRTYEVSGSEENLGMYRVEIYNADVTPNIFLASDILGIAAATDGSESFTVLLTNDSEIVSVDREDYTISAGEVSTGIQVLKGAEEVADFEVILGDEDSDPHTEVLNNVTFTYYPEDQIIKGIYKEGVTVGEKLKITIKVGEVIFTKYFYVKASLAGESAKMIKVTGPQFFQVDAQGFITPESIQLTANPQNIKDLWGWFYYDNEWILIPQGDLNDDDYKFLTITNDDEKWKDKKILEIKAAVYEMDENGNISFDDFYQDTYPVYKITAGKDSYSVIPSNDTINIITNAFGLPVETRDYPIDIKVFSGTTPISFEISEIGIAEGYFNPFIEIDTNSSEADILIKVNKDASQDTEFYNTPINIKIKIDGVAEAITKTIYLQPAQQGADAKQMAVSGGQVFRYNNATDGKINYNPLSTEIVCITNVDHYAWSYRIGNSTNEISYGEKDSPLTILPTFTSSWGTEDILTVKSFECDSAGKAVEDGIFDEITLYKVRDGSDGSDSIFVYPLNPSIIFTESSETGNLIEQTITCQIASFVGIDNKLPDDFTISNSDTNYYTASYNKTSGIISIATKNVKAPSIETERVGEIQCSAILGDTKGNDHTFNFSIKWTIIKGGVDGNGIDYINNYYYAMATNDETSLPAIGDAAWKQKVTDTTYSLTDMYLWNYEEIKFTKNDKPTTTEPFIIGVYGKEGRGIKSFTTYYKVTTTQKPQPSLPSGSPESDNWYQQDSENIEQNSDFPFLWSYELVTYDDGTTEMVGPRLVGSLGKDGEQGPQGPQGETGPQGPQGEPGESAKEIQKITKYYTKYNDPSNEPPATFAYYSNSSWIIYGSGVIWQTTIPTLDETNKYIWSLDLITYENNTTDYLITNKKRDYGAEGLLIAQDFDISGLENYFTRTDGIISFNQDSTGISLTGNSSIFKVTSNAMGFFDSTETPLCYYENGNMILRGTVYANEGVIGGVGENLDNAWRIQGYDSATSTPAAIYAGGRNSLGDTENLGNSGVYIGTNGISLYSNVDEENYLIYNLNKGILEISGNIIADSLIVKEKIEIGDINGLGKPFIRKTAGIYSGTLDSGPTEADDGDIYIKYTSAEISSDGNISAINVSGSSTTFDPSVRQYASGSTLHGQYAYWNFWSDSSSQVQPGSGYAKVGRASSSYKNGSCRMTITPSITGGANSVSSFILNITGRSGLTGSESHYESDKYTGNGTATVKIYNSSNSTVPIAESSFSLGDKTYSDKTYSVDLQGQINSGSTYYVTITASKGSLLYVNKIAFSGSNSAVSSFSPAIKLKSSGQWHTLGAEGSLIEDANTTYTLSLNGTNLILSGSDSSASSVTLPTGTIYTAGSGISIDSNEISLNSTKINVFGNSYYRNIYVGTSTTNAVGSNTPLYGDICFVY